MSETTWAQQQRTEEAKKAAEEERQKAEEDAKKVKEAVDGYKQAYEGAAGQPTPQTDVSLGEQFKSMGLDAGKASELAQKEGEAQKQVQGDTDDTTKTVFGATAEGQKKYNEDQKKKEQQDLKKREAELAKK